MNYSLILILLLLNFYITSGSFVKGKDGDWTHQIDLESENGIKIKWKNLSPQNLDQKDGEKWLVMQVSAKTKGYVGVGFSPHGGMDGGDMVIGWVDSNGKPYLKDFHGEGNTSPILDAYQNYELISATEDDERTTIEFKRKWETCDDDDIDIVKDTMRLIWAYSPVDPKIGNDGTLVTNLQWHGAQARGTVSTYVVDDAFVTTFPNENDPHIKTWDMLMENNEVVAEHTTYFCKILKLPPLKSKHQMIGYKPILNPETKKHVHHITFYECVIPSQHGKTEDVFEKHVNHQGGKCYTANMPPEWAAHCATFLFVWVAGSEGEMLPDHVGTPLGEEHGGATYFMLELHYDNPELKTFKDSSGVKIYYTDNLRPNDGSMLLIGYRITPFLLLPPSQENFVTYGICSRECTEKAFPEDGINIIISLVHAHLSGRKLRLRHFRNGKELPLIAEDNHYDFNYQQSRVLKEEIKVLQGDELMVECEYETTDNNRIVLGGLSTRQEMCQTFLLYYPRIDLMQCTSQYEMNDFFKGLRIDKVNGSVLTDIKMPYNPNLLPPDEQHFDAPDDAKELEESGDGAEFTSMFDHLTIESPDNLKGMSVGSYLKAVNWTDKELSFGKTVEKKWKDGKHYAYCTGTGRTRVPLKNYIIPFPNITEPLKKSKSSCDTDLKTFSYSEPGREYGNINHQEFSSAHTLHTNVFHLISLLLILLSLVY